MKLPSGRLWFLFLCVAALVYCALEARGAGDLLIFLSAAADLDGIIDVYTKSYFDGFHYYYSVLFALLLKPLVILPYYGIKFVWLMFNLVLYCHLFVMVMKHPFVQLLSEKKQKVFLFSVFFFSFRFLHENLHASQITILIMWLSICGLKQIFSGKNAAGALLLAAGISIKLLPVILVPYLIYRGYIKATLCALAFYLLMLFLPSLFVGHDYNMFLVESWWARVNPTNSNHVLDVDERSFHGLSTLLSTLLVENAPDMYALQLKRNILNVSESTLFVVLMVTRGLLVMLTLFFLKWPPFIKAKTQWQLFTEVSYLLLVIPLIFPHQQHYAFIFAVPAFTCICYFLAVNYNTLKITKRNTLLATLIVAYLCGNLRTLIGEFNYLYEHFKILTYGALVLIPTLMWVAAKKEIKDPLQV
jgi:hypothetical protein